MTQFLSSKMSRSVSVDGSDERLTYWCQGCNRIHQVRIKGASVWRWNGNPDRPTFSPSVLVECDAWDPPVTPENIEQWRAAPWEQRQVRKVCHTFITDGMVQFLGDCTHALAGTVQPLPDLPDYLRPKEGG